MLSRDRWVVGRDARVVVIDHDPIRVSFVSPGRAPRAGAPILYPRQPVNDSVKNAYLTERVSQHGIVVSQNGTVTPIRRPPMPRRAVSFVDEVPAFLGDAFVAFDANGDLWVQRPTFGREGGRYYRIDPDGVVRDRIRLAGGHRIVGFGRNAMYVVRRDTDDLEYLQRWALPRQ